ncbi:MAG: hypothetical protein ACRENE_10810, partial [Polyangiaceae bacterium]
MRGAGTRLAVVSVLAAISVAACSSQHGSMVGTGGGQGTAGVIGQNGGNTGSVGTHLFIPNSTFTIDSLNWVITNGTNSYNGTLNMTDDAGNAAQSIEFVAGPVVAGSGYTVTLSGSDSNGDPCTGASAMPFTVSAGTMTTATTVVNVVCTVPTDANLAQTVDSSSVAVDAGVTIQNQAPFQCPGITGISITPAELHPPEAAQISGFETIPANPGGTPTFAWSATCDSAGTPVIGDVNAASTTFGCGTATGQSCTLTLTVGLDGKGADGGTVGQVCAGVGNTTISERIRCEGPSPIVCPSGKVQCGSGFFSDCESLSDGSGPNGYCGACGTVCAGPNPACTCGSCFPAPPQPCNGVSTSCGGCVECDGNASGACTPTEAIFVARDVARGLLVDGQETGSNGCYECLWNAGCLDDTVYLDTGKECGDLTGNVGSGAQASEAKTQACINALNCILPSECANARATSGNSATDGIANCFCGSDYPNTTACSAATSPAPNGS